MGPIYRWVTTAKAINLPIFLVRSGPKELKAILPGSFFWVLGVQHIFKHTHFMGTVNRAVLGLYALHPVFTEAPTEEGVPFGNSGRGRGSVSPCNKDISSKIEVLLFKKKSKN